MSHRLPAELLKRVVADLPSNAHMQTRVSFATCGEGFSLDEVIDSGIVNSAFDTFIACDHLRSQIVSVPSGDDGLLYITKMNYDGTMRLEMKMPT